jgi:site-specific DNA-methyltransferase (adenine-specific)
VAAKAAEYVMKVEIGDAVLYLGDCLEILPTLPKVDAVITDPPYGVGFSGKVAKQRDGGVSRSVGGYESTTDTPDYVFRAVVPAIVTALDIAKRGAITPGTRCLWSYPAADAMGAFYSAAGTGLSNWGFKCSQPILYYGNCPYLAAGLGGRSDSCGQTYPNDANETGHPCAKPLPQMLWLVGRASLESETVLDPFMGSGTTGVACAQLGRKFIGIEIEPKYFDIACRRIEQAYAQGKLFQEPPPKQEQASMFGAT